MRATCAALDRRDDAGTTLLELVVAMTILTIFMGVFTTAILMMTRDTNKVQALSQSVEQGNNAFRQLDRTVRYATGISAPQVASGVWDVEFSTVEQEDGAPLDVCTQLRIKDGVLSQRTWDVPTSGPTAPSKWLPLASDITNGAVTSGADAPLVGAASNGVHRSLRLTLLTTSGAVGSRTTSRTTTTLVAENSTVAATNVCSQYAVGDPS